MDMEQLLAFERIVREGSFSRAARGLNISQPTISARMQTLEQEVGGALFLRHGRTIALTERGENFLPYARRVLEVLAEGVEAIQAAEAGRHGRVTVGTIESLASGFLATALTKFHRGHPLVDLFIRTGHSNQVVEMLYDGIVKLGLIAWPYFNPDLIPLLHFREPLVLVVHAKHPLASRGVVTIEELQQMARPLWQIQWDPTISALLARVKEKTSPSVEVPINTARELLLQGEGAAFLTHTLVREDVAAGHIVEVEVSDLPPIYRESMLVCLKRSGTLPASTTDFIAVLHEEAGKLCISESRTSLRRYGKSGVTIP